MPPLRRIAFAAAIALSVALFAVVMLEGFSHNPMARGIETIAVLVVAAAALFWAMTMVGLKLAGWQEPESEAEFERVVQNTERLARQGTFAEPDETEFMDLDPFSDADFEERVRDARHTLASRNARDSFAISRAITRRCTSWVPS